jgi:hypothetical protein
VAATRSRPVTELPGRRVVVLPRPGRLCGRVALHLSEAVIVPLGTFFGVEVLFGLWPALLAALGWAAFAITAHLLRGGRPSTLLVVTGIFAAVQIGVTAWARSALLYYLQPTLATYGLSVVLFATARRRPPLMEQLAADFCPMPPAFLAEEVIRRFFRRLSWLWGAVLALNASVTLVLLLTIPTIRAVPLATAASVPAFLLALGLSYGRFRHAVTISGFVLVWGSGEAPSG